MSGEKYSFSIIHHRGSLNEATTQDGYTVYRQEQVFIPEWGVFVKCAPYDNHFVFIDPVYEKVIGRWFASCTCGAMATLIGTKAYSHLGSPEGAMLVCHNHTTFNKHADGSS